MPPGGRGGALSVVFAPPLWYNGGEGKAAERFALCPRCSGGIYHASRGTDMKRLICLLICALFVSGLSGCGAGGMQTGLKAVYPVYFPIRLNSVYEGTTNLHMQSAFKYQFELANMWASGVLTEPESPPKWSEEIRPFVSDEKLAGLERLNDLSASDQIMLDFLRQSTKQIARLRSKVRIAKAIAEDAPVAVSEAQKLWKMLEGVMYFFG
jgi:hypothetical protein